MNEEFKTKRIKELLKDKKRLEAENDNLLKKIHNLKSQIRNHKEETISQSEIITNYNRPRTSLTRHIEKKILVPVKIINNRKFFSVSDVEEYVKKFPLRKTVLTYIEKQVAKRKENSISKKLKELSKKK